MPQARFGRAFETGRVHAHHTQFIILYGVVVATLPMLYFYDVLVYRMEGRTGVDPPLPWWLLQLADITWCICLSMSTSMSVPEPPLRITRQVVEFDEEVAVDVNEAEMKSLLGQGHQRRD